MQRHQVDRIADLVGAAHAASSEHEPA